MIATSLARRKPRVCLSATHSNALCTCDPVPRSNHQSLPAQDVCSCAAAGLSTHIIGRRRALAAAATSAATLVGNIIASILATAFCRPRQATAPPRPRAAVHLATSAAASAALTAVTAAHLAAALAAATSAAVSAACAAAYLTPPCSEPSRARPPLGHLGLALPAISPHSAHLSAALTAADLSPPTSVAPREPRFGSGPGSLPPCVFE